MSIKSFGVGVTVATNAVGLLTDVSISGGDVTNVDVTTHDSDDDTREFIGGLIDEGTLELTGHYDRADVGQKYMIDNPAALAAVIVTFSNGSTATFNAVIGRYQVNNNGLDDKVEFSCSLKISGAVTYAAT